MRGCAMMSKDDGKKKKKMADKKPMEGKASKMTMDKEKMMKKKDK